MTRLLEDFAQVSCDWFWEMDKNLRFTYFSNRWEAVFGFSPEREIGKSRLEIALNAEDQALWKPHIDDLLARRPFRDLTYPYRHKDGTIRWLRVSGQPVFGAAGEFQGYRGVGTNVTAEIEADQKLAEALAELKRANGLLEMQNLLFDTALNNMSHGLCMWDAGLRIIVYNKRFLEIFGFSEDVVKPGASLREVLNHNVAIGNYPGEIAEDTVARLGGDEFAVLQAAVGHRDESAALANILINAIAEPYELDGHEVIIGASIGIALAPSGSRLTFESRRGFPSD